MHGLQHFLFPQLLRDYGFEKGGGNATYAPNLCGFFGVRITLIAADL